MFVVWCRSRLFYVRSCVLWVCCVWVVVVVVFFHSLVLGRFAAVYRYYCYCCLGLMRAIFFFSAPFWPITCKENNHIFCSTFLLMLARTFLYSVKSISIFFFRIKDTYQNKLNWHTTDIIKHGFATLTHNPKTIRSYRTQNRVYTHRSIRLRLTDWYA